MRLDRLVVFSELMLDMSISPINAGTDISFSVAISFKACQNSSSIKMLVEWPEMVMDRFKMISLYI
jgi:hypothetical protein